MVFVDPMFIIDMKNNSCMTLKFNLKRYIKTVKGENRLIQSLLSRQKNKQAFLEIMRDYMVNSKLKLSDWSTLFMKINGVYKQASVERSQYKKRNIIIPGFRPYVQTDCDLLDTPNV
jgi:N-glycosylase/DNA lyase